jgi:hypothetical protein
LIIALAACAEDDMQYTVNYAPEFARGRMTVSVFGAFKDGRMSPESWDDLSAKISASLGSQACPVAYSRDFATSNQALASAVDDYARANGITDDLLDQFGPAATGDTIMVLTVAGHPPQRLTDAGAEPQGAARPSRRGGGGRYGRGQMSAPSSRPTPTDHNVFELSASFFSVRSHHSVALASMAYTGPSAEVALQKFADKLRAAVPGATCAGWHWDAPVDDQRIQHMVSE